MAVLNLLSTAVAAPKGMWEWFLNTVFSFVTDYGWRIILFVFILKLLLLPLDFYQKWRMKKNQKISEAIAPEMERLQKQYGNDKQTLSQKQMALQKQAGFSYFSSCIPMILTLVIFFTFFNGMRNISQYMEFKQYVDLYDVYVAREVDLTGSSLEVGGEDWENYDSAEIDGFIKNALSGGTLGEAAGAVIEPYMSDGGYKRFAEDYDFAKDKFNFINDFYAKGTDDATKAAALAEYNAADLAAFGLTPAGDWNALVAARSVAEESVKRLDSALGAIREQVTIPEAQKAVYEQYKQKDSSFLWIKSLWNADVPWETAVPDFDKFAARVNMGNSCSCSSSNGYLNGNLGGIPEDVYAELNKKTTYDSVMKLIRDDKALSGVNGYMILGIIAVGLSFLQQFISMRQQKKSGQVNTGGGAMKVMMFLMPAMIGVFAFTQTSAFTVYMVTNSTLSLLFNLLTSGVLKLTDKSGKGKGGKQGEEIIRYGRPDPNDYVNQANRSK